MKSIKLRTVSAFRMNHIGTLMCNIFFSFNLNRMGKNHLTEVLQSAILKHLLSKPLYKLRIMGGRTGRQAEKATYRGTSLCSAQ